MHSWQGSCRCPRRACGKRWGEFFHYFAGCSIGHGLVLSCVEKLAEPVTMAELREYGIAVPQSWHYLPHRPRVALV